MVEIIPKVVVQAESVEVGDTLQEHQTWLFGYGSVMWNPGFDYLERKSARVHHFQRVFYQGSPDHRGTPKNPGRVVTLLDEQDAWCDGFIYRLAPQAQEEIFRILDQREIEGYERIQVNAHLLENGAPQPQQVTPNVWTYLATETNPAYLGPASPAQIAKEALHCRGESGANTEYILLLARTLKQAFLEDEHVFQVERELLKYLSHKTDPIHKESRDL